MNPSDLDWLWTELRAAVIVRFRVNTPEVEAEVKRALNALIAGIESSTFSGEVHGGDRR